MVKEFKKLVLKDEKMNCQLQMFSKYMDRQVRRSELASRRVGPTRRRQRRQCRHHDGGHDMVSERCRWRSGRIRRGTTGDTSRSEAGWRGVEGCLRGHDDGVSRVDEGGRKRIDSTSKAVTTGSIGIGHRQWFHGLFKIKGSCSPGNSKILTVSFARGVFCIPRR